MEPRPRRRLAVRAARGVAVALAVALGVLVATVVLDRTVNRGRVAELANDAVPGADGAIHVYRAVPDGAGPHPGVVLIHEFWGLRPELTAKADALAARGLHVVAPDTFRGTTVSWVPAAIWNVVTAPADRVEADLRAVVDAMRADARLDPQRIAVVGFCYGGREALRYATGDDRLAGTAVFYGRPILEPERLAELSGPVLGVFGAEDRQIPVADVRAFEAALEEAGVPARIVTFDGVGHAFVSDLEAVRAGGAAGEAWAELERWLDATLGR